MKERNKLHLLIMSALFAAAIAVAVIVTGMLLKKKYIGEETDEGE